MRLAYFSPLPPTPSGISYYSAELLPFLAQRAEIELFVERLPEASAGLPVRPYREFRTRAGEFDAVLYHMGNSPAHAHITETAREIPGVVVLHDVVLHHLMAWLTVERGEGGKYIELMGEAYGEGGRELARAEVRGEAALNRFDFPLCEPLLRRANGVIVHSQHAAAEVRARVPGKPTAVVPMGVPLPPALSKEEARKKLGLSQEAFIAAAFGEVHPAKRVAVILEALRGMRTRRPEAQLYLVGQVSPNTDIRGLIGFLGLTGRAHVPGFVPREKYEALAAAADVCLNLRYPTAGETSASVLRLMGAGRPVIVTRTGAYAELPEGCCIQIEPDEFEGELLAAHLELLAARPELGRAIGAAARRYVAEEHTLEGAAARTIEVLERWRATGYAWTAAEEQAEKRAGETRRVNAPMRLEPAIERLPAPRPTGAGGAGEAEETELQDKGADEGEREVGEAIAALGIPAEDALLEEVARAMVELGIGPRGEA